MNLKHEKKIREVIDRSLSDSDEFTIQFDNDTLSIESAKQNIIYHTMFIILIIVPVLAILWNDRSFYSIVVSVFYFSALGYRYFKILKYEVIAVFRFKERVLIYDNRVFRKLLRRNSKAINFDVLGSVEFRYVKYLRWFGKRNVRVYFRTANKSLPILEMEDEYKAERLKFILTEIVK